MLGRHPTVRTARARRTPGGIRLASRTDNSLRSRLMPTPLPDRLTLTQATRLGGNTVRLLVKEGDLVLQYQPLTHATGLDSVTLFAPAAGHILHAAQGPDGTRVVLVPSGDDKQWVLPAVSDYRALDPGELIDHIAAAGIVGLGGEERPCAAKLRAGLEAGVEMLIVNAVESDPYASADEALMREHAAAVVAGTDMLRRACQAARGLIAIGVGKLDAVAALRAALAGSDLELLITPEKYPLGEARQLVLAASGREVPRGHSTLSAGALVVNAGTAHAVEQAIAYGRPQTSRVVTVTGGALSTPKNLAVPFGTPTGHLLELCGIDRERHAGTQVGGVMRGRPLQDESVPVGATSNCIIALDREELPPPQPERQCIQCGRCASACPVRLQPQQLFGFARTRDHQRLREERLPDCIDCGACDFVCPSHIPLTRYFRAATEELQQAQLQRQRSAHWQARFEFHQARLEREKEMTQTRRGSEQTAATSGAALAREDARTEIAAAVARVRARRGDNSGNAP